MFQGARWSERELNPRHTDFQSVALPTELPDRSPIEHVSGHWGFRKLPAAIPQIMPAVLTESPDEAAWWLRNGHLVIFPTETVYGLGASAYSTSAVRRIFKAKLRPQDNPLIVHIGHLDQVAEVAREVPDAAQRLIDAFFPGPLTVILPRTDQILPAVTGGLDTVAVRMPALSVARQLLEAAKVPVAAPSANISGRPSATTWQAALEDLHLHVQCVLCHLPAEKGLESTVVDCTENPPSLLRPGAISLEDLRDVLPAVSTQNGRMHRSPGTRYRHYAPAADIRLVNHPEEAAANPDYGYIGLTSPARRQYGALKVCQNVDDYGQNLYAFFRLCESRGISRIYCERVSSTGIGLALMDRLNRAARTGP